MVYIDSLYDETPLGVGTSTYVMYPDGVFFVTYVTVDQAPFEVGT